MIRISAPTFVAALYDPNLPGNTVIQELGVKFFHRLQAALGGQTIKPPKKASALTDQHPLVRALGQDDAERLCKAVGGEQFYIPRGTRRLSEHIDAVARAVAAGKSVPQIAAELGISDRHVRNLKKQAAQLLESAPHLAIAAE